MLVLNAEAADLWGMDGGGREVVERESVPFAVWSFDTMTQSSESLDGDESLLDLNTEIVKSHGVFFKTKWGKTHK